MALKKEDCPLVTEELVQLYSRLDAQMTALVRDLPALAETEKVRKLREDFQEVEQLMRRQRYRVGFLGRSQVGKSSTLNNVLHVATDEAPCSPGAGAPATSTITRLHGIPLGKAPTCELRYFTPSEFQKRRDALCRLLGLEREKPQQALEEELAALVSRHREESQRSRREAAPSQSMDEHLADREYFLRFLRSYRQYGDRYVREPPHREIGTYADRHQYTNHPDSLEGSQYLLLAEVEIGFPTVGIDSKLEMIDLPGLGARMASDDETTLSFLPQLDGALLFQSTEQVASKEAYRLLSALREHFAQMEGRVWMVVTKFDNLSGTAILGDRGGKTILDNLAQTLNEAAVPHAQVLLIGNEFYKRSVEEGGRPTPGMYRDILGLEVGPDGQPIIPKPLTRQKQLLAAYQHVATDGGIAELRAVIGQRLADQVQNEVRHQVRREIQRIARELAEQVDNARERAGMNLDDFQNALRWAAQCRRISELLEQERTLLERPGRKLMQELQSSFQSICPEDALPAPRQLPKTHGVFVDQLRRRALIFAKETTLPAIFEGVRDRLQQAAAKAQLTQVRLPGQSSPVAALEALTQEDLKDSPARAWYEKEFQSFEAADLFLNDGDGDLTPADYRRVMILKIDAVVQQAVHVVGRRLKKHLQDLDEKLSDLGNRQAGVDTPIETETFDTLGKALREISDAR